MRLVMETPADTAHWGRMKPIYLRLAGALTLTVAIAACVPRVAAPPPQPAPVATTPPPVAAPTFANWMDAPQTPGDWSYAAGTGASAARFGEPGAEPRLLLRCDQAQGRVTMQRAGVPAGTPSLTIRTETVTRALPAEALAQPTPTTTVSFAPRDPLLDAMAFSKGRFAVETPGLPTLYVPSWVEVTRVIEDCRS